VVGILGLGRCTADRVVGVEPPKHWWNERTSLGGLSILFDSQTATGKLCVWIRPTRRKSDRIFHFGGSKLPANPIETLIPDGKPIGMGIRTVTRNTGRGLEFPYWFLALISVALTAATAPWKLVSWRFSLRTLLIATTLVALVLGLIVWLR
jgi:hypothetical protein